MAMHDPQGAPVGMVTVAEGETGQGLIEMVISLVILSIAITALLAVMTAGALSLQHASAEGTAGTLADKQLEVYRTIAYSNIGLCTTAVTCIPSSGTDPYNSAHTSDAQIPSSSGEVTAATHCVTPLPVECLPVQSVTGPDHHPYRVDTYVTNSTPTSGATTGRVVKQVTVIVRDRSKTTLPIMARNFSTFDSSSNATG
jgi:type II secretory pathway pseudopilin PulG